MIKNYFLIALRNLLKNKSYVIINAFGLGIALACCITAYLLVAFNIEFDSFHADSKVENIYKVHSVFEPNEDGSPRANIIAPPNLAHYASTSMSGIDRYTRFISESGYVRYKSESTNKPVAFSEQVAFADSTFLEMFDFPLASGTHLSMKDRHKIFISENVAKKYFDDKNPIGKVLTLNFINQKEFKVIVGGVLKKIPINSTFSFDIMMRIEHYMDIHDISSEGWKVWKDPSLFIEVSSPEQVPAVEEHIQKYLVFRNQETNGIPVSSYSLSHFKTKYTEDEMGSGYVNLRIGNIGLIVFVSMGLMILLIACFNMTNTSIVMTSKRLKEVGIRKVVGAAREQIVFQFLFETVIVIVLALGVGLSMSQVIVPIFSDMWELQYELADLNGVNMVVMLLILIFVSSLLAGIYPALFNSKFKPVSLLKGNIRINGTNVLTRTLITVQFALSVMVMIAGVVFLQNTSYQEKVNFGYDKDQLTVVEVQSGKEYEILASKLDQNPKILEVGSTTQSLGWNNYDFPISIDTVNYDIRHFGVGENYFETMGLSMIMGTTFSDVEMKEDYGQIVVNQAFLDKTGIDPFNHNKTIKIHGFKKVIVGVVDNHIDNLFRVKEPEPSLFYPNFSENIRFMLVNTKHEDRAEVRSHLEEIWRSQFPDKPFQGFDYEELSMGAIREVNTNLKTIFLFLTFLAGILSASGIFALASLNTEKRSKEIGIRKALGASIASILNLMNREFFVLLSLAGAFGSAGGYFLTKMLLDEIYAYHIAVGLLSVVACVVSIFALGMFTTSFTILRAARVNPVETLRSE
ncbi:MAG: ABC transporter permease [Cyclobacteriaceae bacterium]